MSIPSSKPGFFLRRRVRKILKKHGGDCFFSSATPAAVFPQSISDDGRILLNGYSIGSARECKHPHVRLWDVVKAERIGDLEYKSLEARISGDGKIFAQSCGGGRIEVIDLASMKVRATMEGHRNKLAQFWGLTLNYDGTIIASCGDNHDRISDGSCRIWNTLTGECLGVASNDLGNFHQSVFSMNRSGSFLASACSGRSNILDILDCTMSGKRGPKVLNIRESEENVFIKLKTADYPFQGATASWSSDERRIAVAGDGLNMRIFDVMTGEMVQRIQCVDRLGDVLGLHWIPESDYIFTGRTLGRFSVWDVSAGKCVKDGSVPYPGINFLRYLKASKQLVCVGGHEYWDFVQKVPLDLPL